MGNKSSRNNINSDLLDGVYKQKEDHIKQFRWSYNNSLRSYLSVESQQSIYSVSRPWSRVSRRRWRESTLTLPYESSKTAWPVAQVESYFLPEFPISDSHKDNKFETLQKISKGAFGKIYTIKNLEKNKIFALKVLSKSKVIEDNAVKQVKEEVQIQRACGHHPFIVNCPLNWQSRKHLYIVTEYIEGGELWNLLDNLGALPIKLVQLYVAQLALAIGPEEATTFLYVALWYVDVPCPLVAASDAVLACASDCRHCATSKDFLHDAGVVYRDLKPENILLDVDANTKLIDFGLSKWLSFGRTTHTVCGTPKYMAGLNSPKAPGDSKFDQSPKSKYAKKPPKGTCWIQSI